MSGVLAWVTPPERSTFIYLLDAVEAEPDKTEDLLYIARPHAVSSPQYRLYLDMLRDANKRGQVLEVARMIRELLR